jgi:hypothetical protein
MEARDLPSEDIHGQDEIIIAQEQDAVNKPIHLSLFKEVAGTLVLTNKRLIFACGAEKDESVTYDITKEESTGRKIEEEAENLELDAWGMGGYLFYSEIEDLSKIPPNPKNLFLILSSITAVSGERGGPLGRPTLKVSWKDEERGTIKSTEFQEILTGEDREKNLNDWAPVIEQLKAGTLKIQRFPPAPPTSNVEGKIAYMMGDMQEKGLNEIEQEVEEAFKIELEPDDVEASCEKLVSMGFLDKVNGDAGPFYRKHSPIGIDGLSS